MKPAMRLISTTLVSLIASLFICLPVLAVPQIPSSFYGTVKVNGANVPDGTSVQALIDGTVYADVLTQTYQGDSVYALNVTGDDTDTTVKDGGREGDTVQFKIGGILASQTGVWHSGTNVVINLTASSTSPIATPVATLTPVPTQTAIPTLKPTTIPPTLTKPATAIPPTLTKPAAATATTVVQASPAPPTASQATLIPTSPVEPSLAATQPLLSTSVSSEANQPAPTSTRSENTPSKSSSSLVTIAVVVMVILVVVMIIGYTIMSNREKK
jgi:hypothetical protein